MIASRCLSGHGKVGDQRALGATAIEDPALDATAASEPIDAAAPDPGLDATAATSAAGAPPLKRTAWRGKAFDHFIVIDELGAGGMGVVLAAYDPELDRKVAIKVLRGDAAGTDSTLERTRLMREAQAMAKLSHPNVVTVFEVGVSEGLVFIAMEYVDGGTLTRWLDVAKRSQSEIIDMFAAAGQGLVAAHAAGLVHRDFKPDNVLVGSEGRARVSDFGLVGSRAAVAHVELEHVRAVETALSTSLTMTGAVMGTPIYMAPEQHEGGIADARTDQFSFCVALYEALYGERPFAGETLGELKRNVLAGAIQAGDGAYVEGRGALPRARVPAWLRAVVIRGLSTDPQARYPSMTALLDALRRDPTRAQRRWMVAGAIAASLSGGVVWFSLRTGAESTPCRGAEVKLAGTWGPSKRAALVNAFTATGIPNASDTAGRVASVLDDWAGRWVSMHVETCEATRVRGDQSEHVLDLRMACLERRRQEAAALADVFIADPEASLRRALKAAYDLGDVDSCARVQELTARVPPPSSTTERAAVESIGARIARLKALKDSGRYEDALPVAIETVEASKRAAYKPIEAEALFWLAELQDDLGDGKASEQTSHSAMAAGMAGHDDVWIARAANQLVWLSSYDQARFDEGHRWARLSRASLERLGGSDEVAGSVAGNFGSLLMMQHRFDDAAVELRRSLDLRKKTYPPHHPKVARAMFNLGNLAYMRNNYAEAQSLFREVIPKFEKGLGPEHPDVALAYNSLGATQEREKLLDEALRSHQRALAIRERMLGPEHQDTATSWHNIANVHYAQNRYADALPMYRRALAIYEKQLPASHPWITDCLTGMGRAEWRTGHRAEAITALTRASEILAKGEAVSGEHAKTAFALAQVLWDGGNAADKNRARALALEARAGFASAPEYMDDVAKADAWLKEHGVAAP